MNIMFGKCLQSTVLPARLNRGNWLVTFFTRRFNGLFVYYYNHSSTFIESPIWIPILFCNLAADPNINREGEGTVFTFPLPRFSFGTIPVRIRTHLESFGSRKIELWLVRQTDKIIVKMQESFRSYLAFRANKGLKLEHIEYTKHVARVTVWSRV